MTMFWIVAIAATLGTLVMMLLPLARKAKGEDAPARGAFDLTVYKDQLAEIDRDLDRGVLSEDQALSARTEIERRMLAIAGDDQGANASPAASGANAGLSGALIVAIGILVPLGAFGGYFYLGNPGLADRPLAERTQGTPQPIDTADRQAQLAKMVADLEARTEQTPNNPDAWNVLGQAYEMQGDADGALRAYTKLVEVTDRHPQALIILAEAMFVQAGEVVTPAAKKLFMESRTKDPANPLTYYYVALAYQAQNDLQRAMDEYAGLLTVSPENSEWVPDIQGRMAALAQEMGVEVPVVEMLPPAAPKQPVAPAPGPNQQQMQAAQDMSPEDQQAMIASMVERLATRLQENPDDLAGWQRLAQAYRVLGDDAGLAEAEAQIKRLSGQ